MIVTRIPPSPTGHLHIGTARTALFNYLFAKQAGGRVVFRSEDTDKIRSKREFEAEIILGLQWLGISWDNQEIVRQSERAAIYREHLDKLVAGDKAYVSKEESKNNPGEMVEVVRLRNPNKKITFNDLVRGDITLDTTELGDMVIARNLDDALYHFTVVVDDHLMGVTHVIRGEDHISNTPRQILIQEALDIPRPVYAHLPLILASDRSKMSKRHGAVALDTYRDEGFTKEAIINYLTLLGWNPGTDQELFTLPDLVKAFSIDGIQKGGAVFDIKKFSWFNKEYIKRYNDAEFLTYLRLEDNSDLPAYFTNKDVVLRRLIPSIRERISSRKEFVEHVKMGEYDFAFITPATYEPKLLMWKNDKEVDQAKPRLENAHKLLTEADFSSGEAIKEVLWAYAEEVGKGELFWPLRIALSGKAQSPDPFTIAYTIGKDETLARIKAACDKIGNNV